MGDLSRLREENAFSRPHRPSEKWMKRGFRLYLCITVSLTYKTYRHRMTMRFRGCTYRLVGVVSFAVVPRSRSTQLTWRDRDFLSHILFPSEREKCPDTNPHKKYQSFALLPCGVQRAAKGYKFVPRDFGRPVAPVLEQTPGQTLNPR